MPVNGQLLPAGQGRQFKTEDEFVFGLYVPAGQLTGPLGWFPTATSAQYIPIGQFVQFWAEENP